MILCFSAAIYVMLKDENSILNEIISKSTEKVIATVSEIEETENVEDIKETDEERYLKYIKPNEQFNEVKIREKKDIIRFAGDIYFSNHVSAGYDKKGIAGVIDKSIKSLIDTSDICVGNLECCITDKENDKEEKKEEKR